MGRRRHRGPIYRRARFSGSICKQCQGSIQAGETICLVDGRWVHAFHKTERAEAAAKEEQRQRWAEYDRVLGREPINRKG